MYMHLGVVAAVDGRLQLPLRLQVVKTAAAATRVSAPWPAHAGPPALEAGGQVSCGRAKIIFGRANNLFFSRGRTGACLCCPEAVAGLVWPARAEALVRAPCRVHGRRLRHMLQILKYAERGGGGDAVRKSERRWNILNENVTGMDSRHVT